jgi:hypothetical protein
MLDSSDKNVADRMRSPVSDLCQRSIVPFVCGENGEVRTCIMPEIRNWVYLLNRP